MGRREELARLGEVLAGGGPSLVLLSGRRGAGASALVRRALENAPPGTRAVVHRAAPVTDRDQRRLFARAVARGADGTPPDDDADWPALLGGVAERVERTREPLVLVLDGLPEMVSARRRFPDALADTWSRVRARALPLHVVVVGAGPEGVAGVAGHEALGPHVTLELTVGPLSFREVAGAFGGWSPVERLAAWGVFGGMPSTLRHLSPSSSLAANVRRALLAPDAPLLHHGERLLGRALQSPARYASVMRALSLGNREWGEVVAAVPDFGSAGQLAPYVARLEALGWIEVSRSVDAAPGSRSRRYRVADPFLAFWHRFVLPSLGDLEAGATRRVWTERIRPRLDRHLALHFPALCREWLRLHADEVLGTRAREVSGLWGPDYDLDLGGTLRSGAVVYGVCRWRGGPPTPEDAWRIGEAIRATRYGFGRENRLRLVASTEAPDPRLLRMAARDPMVRVVGPAELLGGGPPDA